MIRVLVLCLPCLLAACEPCAVVLGGHCSDRQHDDIDDQVTKRQPVPLAPFVVPRGARG